ncbi:MAG: serine hydrolase [Lachnospiraceae bacterium]
MEELYDEDEDEQARIRRSRRAQRMAEMRRNKQKQRLLRMIFRKSVPFFMGAAIIVIFIFGIRNLFHKSAAASDFEPEKISAAETENTGMEIRAAGMESVSENGAEQPAADAETEEEPALPVYYAEATDATASLGEDVISSQAILIDKGMNQIVAQRDAKTIINPASMTKILTILVAAEHVENLDDTFTITIDITDYSYTNDCSIVGFAEDETVTVRDLFYGTILPSGADAAIGLATYVAGSQEAFVELMNQKLYELGLSETAHFTNVVGIYDENHYCTVYDMAMILSAAVDNELCREVLSAHTYTTSSTEQHPDGITVSNWFLRRIEDKDSGGEVLCGKTGYVVQSGNCSASIALDADGNEYICVTVNSNSAWRCIYDHVAIYKQFLPQG